MRLARDGREDVGWEEARGVIMRMRYQRLSAREKGEQFGDKAGYGNGNEDIREKTTDTAENQQAEPGQPVEHQASTTADPTGPAKKKRKKNSSKGPKWAWPIPGDILQAAHLLCPAEKMHNVTPRNYANVTGKTVSRPRASTEMLERRRALREAWRRRWEDSPLRGGSEDSDYDQDED